MVGASLSNQIADVVENVLGLDCALVVRSRKRGDRLHAGAKAPRISSGNSEHMGEDEDWKPPLVECDEVTPWSGLL